MDVLTWMFGSSDAITQEDAEYDGGVLCCPGCGTKFVDLRVIVYDYLHMSNPSRCFYCQNCGMEKDIENGVVIEKS